MPALTNNSTTPQDTSIPMRTPLVDQIDFSLDATILLPPVEYNDVPNGGRDLGTWTPLMVAAMNAWPDAPAKYVPAVELPAGHRMVLIIMRGGELAGKVLEHMREQGIPEPTPDDYAAAIERGHIRWMFDKVQGEWTHKFLPPGGWAAADIVRDLACKFQIHHFIRRNARGNQGPSTHCTCGWKAHTGTRSGMNVLSVHETVHLQAAADAKSRGLKPPMEQARLTITSILRELGEGYGR